jgi:hypothetical protein
MYTQAPYTQYKRHNEGTPQKERRKVEIGEGGGIQNSKKDSGSPAVAEDEERARRMLGLRETEATEEAEEAGKLGAAKESCWKWPNSLASMCADEREFLDGCSRSWCVW